MRLPISSVIASLVVSLTTPSSPTFAQQNTAGSTIRLTSTSEPASSSSAPDSNLPSTQPAIEHRQAAPPIQQLEQPAEQSDRSLAPPIVHTPVQTSANTRTRMPAGFYASPAARSALNQQPGRARVQSAPRPQVNRRGGKPFQAVSTQSTISPYLYLNAGANTSNSMTNYFAFVEQAESGRQQQREIQQLRSQLQKMPSTGAGSQSANPNPVAHYMDTAQFYRGLQR